MSLSDITTNGIRVEVSARASIMSRNNNCVRENIQKDNEKGTFWC